MPRHLDYILLATISAHFIYPKLREKGIRRRRTYVGTVDLSWKQVVVTMANGYTNHLVTGVCFTTCQHADIDPLKLYNTVQRVVMTLLD